MVDIAHFAGLVAGGVHPSPFPHAHVVTTTTHKTLRGPRGGMILTNDEELAKKINRPCSRAPGRTADARDRAKAVALRRGAEAGFKRYAQAWSTTPRRWPRRRSRGYDLVTGGTDTHLMLVDLRPKNLTGSGGGRSRARRNDMQQERHPVRPGKARW